MSACHHYVATVSMPEFIILPHLQNVLHPSASDASTLRFQSHHVLMSWCLRTPGSFTPDPLFSKIKIRTQCSYLFSSVPLSMFCQKDVSGGRCHVLQPLHSCLCNIVETWEWMAVLSQQVPHSLACISPSSRCLTFMLSGSSAPTLTAYFCNSNDVGPISTSFCFCLSLFESLCCFVYLVKAQGEAADCGMLKSLSLVGCRPPWVRIR